MAITCATPVPVRVTICGLSAASSLMERVAERTPEALGVKVMLRKQDWPAVNVRPWQKEASTLKSPALGPVRVRLPPCTGTELVFVAVTPRKAGIFSGWLPKLRFVGLTETSGTAPNPVRGAGCGLAAPVTATERFALRVSCTVGENETMMMQLAPAASGEALVQVVPAGTTAKSPEFAPVMEGVIPDTEEAVPFVMVNGSVKLVEPRPAGPKLKLDGNSVTADAVFGEIFATQALPALLSNWDWKGPCSGKFGEVVLPAT